MHLSHGNENEFFTLAQTMEGGCLCPWGETGLDLSCRAQSHIISEESTAEHGSEQEIIIRLSSLSAFPLPTVPTSASHTPSCLGPHH